MIAALRRAHRGQTFFYYLDVSLAETLRQHATRPQASQFSADDMRGWYRPGDLLGFDGERAIRKAPQWTGATTGLAAMRQRPSRGVMSRRAAGWAR